VLERGGFRAFVARHPASPASWILRLALAWPGHLDLGMPPRTARESHTATNTRTPRFDPRTGGDDSHGAQPYGDESAQMDIVITNGDQPFTFPSGESGEYVIEGVSAVGEVKSNLTPHGLTDCIKQGSKYKQLRPTFGPQDQVTNLSDFLKESDLIPPFFVLAFESNMKMQTIIDKLKDVEPVEIPPDKPCPDARPQPPTDAVCVLGKGLALFQRSSLGPILHVHTTGEPYLGWYALGAAPLLAGTTAQKKNRPQRERSFPMDTATTGSPLACSPTGSAPTSSRPPARLSRCTGMWR
jgi:hypothetical protein